jgi:hypothetical protein
MRSVSYLKVQGHEGLVRDVSSGAIISNNNNEYNAFKLKRENELKRQRQIEDQVKELNDLKSEMLEIKQMLNILIKGK